MGVNQAHNQVGELMPLTFAPALAATFGVQPVLVASGICLMALAVLGLPEAVAVDRRRAAMPLVPAAAERVEEPISPNP
jgi:hypothetical protein